MGGGGGWGCGGEAERKFIAVWGRKVGVERMGSEEEGRRGKREN
jgi:hypothetical protein